MHFLRCAIPGEGNFWGAVTRVIPGSRPGEAASTQTLVICGTALLPLIGAGELGAPLELGPPLLLHADPAARDGGPAAARRPYEPTNISSLIWDAFSSAVYMIDGYAIVRLSNDGTVTLVAGSVDETGDVDGPGGSARFREASSLASDGVGSLYVAGQDRLRKLQLPGGGRGAGMAGASPTTAADDPVGDAAAVLQGQVLVSTLPLQAPSVPTDLAFGGGTSGSGGGSSGGGGSGSLLFATQTALYRLSLAEPAAAPSVVAGREGVPGTADGRGADARFNYIQGITLDGDGAVYVMDWSAKRGAATSRLCRVAVDGTVATLIARHEGRLAWPAILPNGCLLLSDLDIETLILLFSHLKLPPFHAALAPAGPTGPPPRTLPADLGALLDRQPDGTADVTIVVGGRTFHAHRLLLSARSDYFGLGAGFVDGSTQQLSLPDADPDAFELFLRFVYTGAVEIPAAQAVRVAELADNLLVPELREQAAAVVEAMVSSGSVAGLLLWAEARGPAFSGLLSRLKAWYIENHEVVMKEAGDEAERLAVQSPRLFFELMRGTCSRPSKRPRTTCAEP